MITGVVTGFAQTETVHGTADYAVVEDVDTNEETFVIIGGGLNQLKNQEHKLVRLTYEGEKENPNPKKGRAKVFKAYKVEVDDDFDPFAE